MPKETEFEGLSNLVEAVSRYSDVKGKTLFACLPSFQEGWRQWGALDDVVRRPAVVPRLAYFILSSRCWCWGSGAIVLLSCGPLRGHIH